MRILISGSHGLVGKAVIAHLVNYGHHIVRLVREEYKGSDRSILWDPKSGKVEKKALSGFDAVIHLAGENIASSRWTKEKKKKIYDSRVVGTQQLCKVLAKVEEPPRIFLSSSAIGFYGDSGDKMMDEQQKHGEGFLANLCSDWEKATKPLKKKSTRVVHLRFGVILSLDGGALAKMLPPIEWGVGGRMGSGKQYMSWISIEDVARAIFHVITHDSLEGPVNIVAPNPVTNSEFTNILGKLLDRPTRIPFPGFMARLILGEMAKELLLSSTRVEPVKLLESEFEFAHSNLEEAFLYLFKGSSV